MHNHTHHHHRRRGVVAAGDDFVPAPVPEPPDGIPASLPEEALPDLGVLQTQWQQRLDGMLEEWPTVSEPLIDRLVAQVAAAEASGDLVAVQDLSVVTYDVAVWAEDASMALAAGAAEIAAREADDQDVEVSAGRPDHGLLASVAQVSAATLGAGLVLSAVREALRWWGRRGASPSGVVAGAVREHLLGLTAAQPEYVLGGMLTGAQREGRAATARSGPGAALYSSEKLDSNTCKNCRDVNGKWLGNSDDPNEPWMDTYPVRGYVHCLGRDRCRGQIVYVWRGGSDWTKWIEKEPWR